MDSASAFVRLAPPASRTRAYSTQLRVRKTRNAGQAPPKLVTRRIRLPQPRTRNLRPCNQRRRMKPAGNFVDKYRCHAANAYVGSLSPEPFRFLVLRLFDGFKDLLAQPGKLSGKLLLQKVQFSGGRAPGVPLTEVLHFWGQIDPVFRRTTRWLARERSPRISC